MIKQILGISIILLSFHAIKAQKELVLYKGWHVNRISFPLEYTYTFKDKLNQKHSGTITTLLDSAVILNQNDTLLITHIKKIHTPFRRQGQVFFGELLFKGGLFLIIADPINNLINNDKPYFKTMGKLGVISAPLGYLTLIASRKSYKIRRHYALKIVNI